MGKTPVPSKINVIVLDESYENVNNEFKNLRSKKQLLETRNLKSQKYYDMVNRLKDKIKLKTRDDVKQMESPRSVFDFPESPPSSPRIIISSNVNG